jgi:hypothetical protein
METIWASEEIELRDRVKLHVVLNADESITLGTDAGRPLAQDLTFVHDDNVQALIVALQTALNRKRAQRGQ